MSKPPYLWLIYLTKEIWKAEKELYAILQLLVKALFTKQVVKLLVFFVEGKNNLCRKPPKQICLATD